MNGPILSFEIVKRYPGFSLECRATFESGITAVFGPSGSGKTTLLNSIAGLVRPDEGAVRVLGETVFSSSPRRSLPPEKRRLGYVFQDSALFPHMSVWDNIRYGHKLASKGRPDAELEHLVELFQLSGLLQRGVVDLSGGERQRVALARALATSPRLLLLDEPLASLDTVFKGVIIRYLKRIWSELGTPMVYVSHSISEVMAVAQDMLVLRDGRVVAQGPPSQGLVHPEVSAIADYSPLENLLEAQVLTGTSRDDLAELAVGETRLWVSYGGAEPGDVLTISVGASDILLALEAPSKISARNVLRGTVREVHVRGTRVLVYVDIGERVVVEVTRGALRELGLAAGQDVYLIIKSASVVVLDSPRTPRGS